jgi:hypothetical protein
MTHETQRKVWDFIEKYYPNYYSCSDIAQISDLDIEIEQNEYSNNKLIVESLTTARNIILSKVFEKSIEAYVIEQENQEKTQTL